MIPSRAELVEELRALLDDAGFVVTDPYAVRPASFDLAARRGDDLVIVKVLGNVDALDAETGAELRRLGAYLDATPLVVGERTRDERLKPEVAYFRHGVAVVNPDTAYDLFVESVPPLIYAAPGGLYVNVDGDLLSEAREARDWSLGRLASELGVSRRAVSKYEDGMSASIDVAVRLQELFGRPFSTPVDVLGGAESVRDTEPTPDAPEAEGATEHVVRLLGAAGYTVHPTRRSPFAAVAEDDDGDDDRLLTGSSALDGTGRKRAQLMASVGEIARARSVYFVDDRADREAIDRTAIVSWAEVDDDPDRVRRLVEERSADAAEG